MAGLTTSTGSGAQATTQSPQAAVGTGLTTAQSSDVQPGTATSLLNSQNGVPLHVTNLSTVSIGDSTSPQTQQQAVPAVTHHHFNPALLGLSGILIIIAVALFWFANQSVKNTTKYS